MSRILVASLLLAAAPAAAQTVDANRVQIAVTPYVWLSAIDSDVTFRGATQPIGLSAGDVLSQLKIAFMGRTIVEKGRIGLVTDLVYAKLRDKSSASRDLLVGEEQLPANVTADLDLRSKTFILTLAPRYKLIDQPNYKLYALAGTRHLYLRQFLDYQLLGSVGDVPAGDRQGDLTAKIDNWDFVAGFSGEYSFGKEQKWFLPYAFDLGGGDSKFTYQALGGFGYRFSWGDAVLVYRYLHYDFSGAVDNFRQHGPALGATFRF